jgi:hypothetical protein
MAYQMGADQCQEAFVMSQRKDNKPSDSSKAASIADRLGGVRWLLAGIGGSAVATFCLLNYSSPTPKEIYTDFFTSLGMYYLCLSFVRLFVKHKLQW